ncbi:putative ste24 endopeptidase [Medicago truncatula]|uniref:Putative ste24 endopeptidase n=1 Tax=Medicago truncatula TaxID=3880 RepID=A0A396I8N2_MEDTR|nr:putative ste24 endopeptidase [Medicago truncatula]
MFILLCLSVFINNLQAYMYGFFKNKRIVLYDTLVQQILTLVQFGGYTLVRNSTDLFQCFGFDTQPVLIGLILFQML